MNGRFIGIIWLSHERDIGSLLMIAVSLIPPSVGREAVGDGVVLVADFNQGLDLGEALQRCRAPDTEGLAWIEEPLRYDDLDGHARLARDILTPVMPGQNFYGRRAMHQAIRAAKEQQVSRAAVSRSGGDRAMAHLGLA